MHINCMRGLEILGAVLLSGDAPRIVGVEWLYRGTDGVSCIIPLLAQCPNLEVLSVDFYSANFLELDFFAKVLEAGCPAKKIVVDAQWGNAPRFFREVAKSRVVSLVAKKIDHPNFMWALCAALRCGDPLRELHIQWTDHLPDEFWEALFSPKCALVKFSLSGRRGPGRVTTDLDTKRCAKFARHQRLFVLLQAQQLKRLGNPLRRLPVEMVRMVGGLL